MLAAFLPKSVTAILHTPMSAVTDEQFCHVMADLGLGSWHPELRQSAISLLRGRGIDTAAEVIHDPEAIKQLSILLKSLRAGPSQACEFCGGEVRKAPDGFNRCTSCSIVH